MLDLTSFRRICIIGPTSSGKTTLAEAIGRKLGYPVVHLDNLMHQPGWQPRGWEAFTKAHDAAIAGETWVMEGSYKQTFPQRFARADLVIYVDVGRLPSAWRFFRRLWLNHGTERPFAPSGCKERLTLDSVWHLGIKHAIFKHHGRREAYLAYLAQHPHLAIHRITRFKDVLAFYQAHGLDLPAEMQNCKALYK